MGFVASQPNGMNFSASVAYLHPALARPGQTALKDVITGTLDVPAYDQEVDVLAFAKRSGMTLYHPTSTCPIGSVVDSDLKVIGLQTLRVVDASVVHSVLRRNTNAPTIMIAEKAADLNLAGEGA